MLVNLEGDISCSWLAQQRTHSRHVLLQYFQYFLSSTYMLSQQVEDRSQQLEARVAALEAEITQMRQLLSVFIQKKSTWWLKVAGSFENDPYFDETIRLGQEWRKSAE